MACCRRVLNVRLIHQPFLILCSFHPRSRPTGSLGADIGCGNGKYMGLNENVFLVGCDRSSHLLQICSDKGFDVQLADGLTLPYRSKTFVCFLKIRLSEE